MQDCTSMIQVVIKNITILIIFLNVSLLQAQNLVTNQKDIKIKKDFMYIKKDLKQKLNNQNIDFLKSKIPTKEEIKKLQTQYSKFKMFGNKEKNFLLKIENKQKNNISQDLFNTFILFLEKNEHIKYSEEKRKQIKKELLEALYPKKYPTILYLFSTSIPKQSVHNVYNSANNLKSIFQNFQFYGVIRGINIKNFKYLLGEYIDFRNSNNIVKVHPIIYEDFHIKKVPAFIYAECPKKFKYRKCDFKYIAFGDFSLKYFLELLSNENKKYSIYYDKYREKFQY